MQQPRKVTIPSVGLLLGALSLRGEILDDVEAQRRVENYMAAHELCK